MFSMRWLLAISISLCVVCGLATAHVSGGDWPQILGPHRNGTAHGESLANEWPSSGPNLIWERKVGSGYAGLAVRGSLAVAFHRVDEIERLEGLNVETGDRLWKKEFDVVFRASFSDDSGPRCVPLIHEDSVFAFGAAGNLHCVNLTDGELRWSRDLYSDYRADSGYFGAGSTPIVADNKILVNIGGRDGAGVLGLDVDDGTTIWKATKERASYSSPVHISINGQSRILFVTRMKALVISPKDGQVLWELPFGKTGPTVNAASPLVFDDRVFLTSSYGIGAVLADYTSSERKVLWQDSDKVISSQYNSCVFRNDFIYGIHGREDAGPPAELRCVEAETGRVMWSEPRFGTAHLIMAGDRMLALKVDGSLVLFEISPQRYIPLQTARVLEGPARALPALSNGRLFVRNSRQSRSTVKCFQVGT